MTPSWQILEGDCRTVLRSLPEQSVHTVVTSPPYFGLRDYGTAGQIGLEPTPDEFVAALVAVFREVRRVLRDDGTVWLNLGDSYASQKEGNTNGLGTSSSLGAAKGEGSRRAAARLGEMVSAANAGRRSTVPAGCKPKDLIGIPWMVAFALRADGWYLRSDIIWAKPNPMPESVTDRPTKAHEYVFLLSKGPRYHFDADAIREERDEDSLRRSELYGGNPSASKWNPDRNDGGRGGSMGFGGNPAGRNKRSVWTVATQPYAGAHFATFPPKLIEPCVLAGAPERACGWCGAPWERVVERTPGESFDCPKTAASAQARGGRGRTSTVGQSGGSRVESVSRTLGFEPSCECGDYGPRNSFTPADTKPGVVLDPFAGAGTTGLVALRHNRSFIGIELNPAYAAMARERIRDDAPLLNAISELAA